MNYIDQPLFIEAEHEKVAMLKMSQDVNEWDENIIEHLHDEYPDLTDSNIEVVFKKTDAQKGYGYGFVGLGKESEVKIPIIIKEYEMSPLDVMLHDDNAYPLTKDSIKSMLQKTAMGTLVAKPKSSVAYVGPNVSERVYPGIPWSGGHYKYASILSAIDLTQEQIDGFSKKFKDDPTLLDAWRDSSCRDILKISAANQPEVDKVKPGEAHPLVEALLKATGEDSEYGVVDRAGKYEVKGLSGKTYKGIAFPKVYDFQLRPQGVMVFVKGELVKPKLKDKCTVPECSAYNLFAMQASIVGKKIGDIGDDWFGSPVSSGERGMFIIKRGSASMAFSPVKILSSSRTEEKREVKFRKNDIEQDITIEKEFTTYKYIAVDSFGARYKIVVSPIMKDVKMVNGVVMMPGDTKFVEIGDMLKLRSSIEQMKTSSGYSVTMRHLGGESFSIEAPWSEDWVKEGGIKSQVEDYLSQYYKRESLGNVFAECEKVGMVNFSDRAPEVSIADNQYEGAEKIAKDLTKCAASLNDASLVDNVLSLQFINKDNVNKYIDFIPQLEKAASDLADMLIGARLGMNVEEYPIKTAMENVVEVINDLKVLRG